MTRRASAPIVWSLLDDAERRAKPGHFHRRSPPSTGAEGSSPDDDVVPNDIADEELFDINQNGVLTFVSPPDFETRVGGTADDSNTYQVVVQASDGGVGSFVNWFKVNRHCHRRGRV